MSGSFESPDLVRILMITSVKLGTKPGLERLLDAFERQPSLVPTSSGEDERAQSPYERARMIADVLAAVERPGGEFLNPGLARRKPIKYEAYFGAQRSGLSMVFCRFGAKLKEREVGDILSFADALAEQLTVHYGCVHLAYRANGQQYNSVGSIGLKELQAFGPQPLATRTWLGPHIVGIAGKDALLTAGLQASETAWGAVRLDLCDLPSGANAPVVLARQTEAMSKLAATGVFGDYTDLLDYKPGPSWRPIPAD